MRQCEFMGVGGEYTLEEKRQELILLKSGKSGMGVSWDRFCNKNSWCANHLFPEIIRTIESDRVFSVKT